MSYTDNTSTQEQIQVHKSTQFLLHKSTKFLLHKFMSQAQKQEKVSREGEGAPVQAQEMRQRLLKTQERFRLTKCKSHR